MNFVRINDYPNYVIHPCGTILRIYKNKTKELNGSLNFVKGSETLAYKRFTFSKNNVGKMLYLHRLLALHFIPNPENKPTIDHKNRNPLDNRLENLRWASNHEQNLNRIIKQKVITKGRIFKRKNRNSWRWGYYISGKAKSKSMTSKEDLEKYRIELLKKYNISI
mgnify:CR=1 FL=1